VISAASLDRPLDKLKALSLSKGSINPCPPAPVPTEGEAGRLRPRPERLIWARRSLGPKGKPRVLDRGKVEGLIFFKVCDNKFEYFWELKRFPGKKI